MLKKVLEMAKQEFELFLSDDQTVKQRCLDRIVQLFGVMPKRVYKDSAEGFENFYAFAIEDDKNIWDIARKLASIEGVIEVDPITKIFGVFNKPKEHDDVPHNTQWNHSLTRFSQAVEFSKNQGKLDVSAGTSITIVQLDTGYTPHPEISMIASQDGKNFVEDDGGALDRLVAGLADQPGHGTATASVIIGRKTDVPGDSNNGVFPYVKFIPYRISTSVIHITRNTIPEAIIEAVDSGCNVITMSMGGAPPRRSWRQASAYALSKGVIFVSAAGNVVRFVVWPARYKQVIGVAGVNFDGLPWEGSCRGPSVEISAPAENVFVARTPEPEKFIYKFGSGTSHATPHVAAAAA
jgi:subtilisin family serine protease